MRQTLARVTVTGAAVALMSVVAGSPAPALTLRLRVGSTPALPAGARAVAALPARQPLRLTIALQPQSPAALAAFASAVSTPGSPEFRHYLTVSEFAQRF